MKQLPVYFFISIAFIAVDSSLEEEDVRWAEVWEYTWFQVCTSTGTQQLNYNTHNTHYISHGNPQCSIIYQACVFRVNGKNRRVLGSSLCYQRTELHCVTNSLHDWLWSQWQRDNWRHYGKKKKKKTEDTKTQCCVYPPQIPLYEVWELDQ